MNFSGTLIIKPVQGKLTHDVDTFTKMDPYCQVTLGSQVVKGKVCNSGGKTPHWEDTITLKWSGEPVAFIELKDKDAISSDEIIGVCQLDLHYIGGHSAKWWPIYYKQKPAGEVLFDITLSADGGAPITYKKEDAAHYAQGQKIEHPHMSDTGSKRPKKKAHDERKEKKHKEGKEKKPKKEKKEGHHHDSSSSSSSDSDSD